MFRNRPRRSLVGQQGNLITVSPPWTRRTGKHVVVTLAFVYLLLVCSFWFHPRDPIPAEHCVAVSSLALNNWRDGA